MTRPLPSAFDASHAAAYDKAFAKLSSFKDALHILTHASLVDLADDARVLCLGAGTGAELLFLARLHPGWTFTALDVSAPMLDVCRARVAAAGWTDRVRFHVGPLDSLPHSAPYDAVTSLLVSQFILDRSQRQAFFAQAHARLKPQGRLVTADLAADLDGPDSAGIVETWRGALQYNGSAPADFHKTMAAYRTAVAVVPEAQVHDLLSAAGFQDITRFFQAGLMHAWHARRPRS